MKRLLLLSSLVIMAFASTWASITCKGIVVDETGEPLIGASVLAVGTNIGVATDIDGRFTLSVPDNVKEIRVDYVGYNSVTKKVAANLGEIALTPDSKMLQDVVVTQSLVKTRKTPVAASTINAEAIDLKLGNQEFPEMLKTTPGVWATKDGGGYGDAKINIRGFKSENTGMLVNGVPVNDMEWGGIYWSNWSGLSDVTTMMQTQRGLGASIISVPSVGGTINIQTRSLDARKGGSMWYGMGNDNMNQIGFTVSTGLMDNGWAITVLGSRRWGDGYVQGTPFNAYTYFANVSKRINDHHQLSFTAMGSPQVHFKRSSQDGLSIDGWYGVKNYMNGESMYRYNPTFGYDNEGQVRSSQKNVYHKPQISLSHIWTIDFKSSLNTVLYASFAQGYGTSGQGRTTDYRYYWYGASNGVLNTTFRRPDGTFDYGAIQDMNAASETGSNMVMSISNNAHNWIGLISNYKNEILPKKLNLTAGIDFRYYVGYHNNEISDLYSGSYYIDDSSRGAVKVANNAAAADPNWKYQKLGVGDVVYRDYIGYTVQEGAYAQLEYTALEDKLTAILSGSLNNTTYWRVDHFYYDKEHEKSATSNHLAGSVKGGVNYNINRNNNVYVNGGYLTRAPFFSGGVFLKADNSNAINPDATNEKCAAVEVGYEYHSPIFTATLNGYYIKWLDKTATRGDYLPDGDRYFFNMTGVNSRHMGVEVNFKYIPAKWVDINGMFSLGDWIWDSTAEGYFYNSLGQPLADLKGNIASGILAPDHAKAQLNQKGVKVGGSAQLTAALGVNFKPFKGFRIGADWTVAANNYSDYTITSSDYQPGAVINVKDPWRIPWGNQLDLNASYRFPIGKLNAVLSGNVYNLFNYNYVMDAYTPAGAKGTWENAFRVFYSFGRTFALRLKVEF